jgi:maleate isomerase
MVDVLGWRNVFGVLAPSTNTVVEPDYYRMTVPGVTPHVARIHIRNQTLTSNDDFEGLLDQIRAEINAACERVLTCDPDYLVMGMSAETFWGGIEGNRLFTEQIETFSGKKLATGADAVRRALDLFGARRLGVITPYQPIADDMVRLFLTEAGYDVVNLKGLKCPSAVDIARVSEETLRQSILEVDGPDIDAIVQVGTNLSMVGLADEAERWLGKPVIAINAATWWHALRTNGITDQVRGSGTLLREH